MHTNWAAAGYSFCRILFFLENSPWLLAVI